MLWRLQRFRFDIGVFLNFARDHQDWHKDMNDYLLAKANILHCADIAITSQSIKDDLTHIQSANDLDGRPIKAPVRQRLKVMIAGLFRRHHTQKNQFLTYQAYPHLNPDFFPGDHNSYNAGAVHSILQQLFGQYDESLWSDLQPLAHRLQSLEPIHGITLVDDGICTSAHSLMTALQAQSPGTVLIC